MAGHNANSSTPIVRPAIRAAREPAEVSASKTSAGHARATIDMASAA